MQNINTIGYLTLTKDHSFILCKIYNPQPNQQYSIAYLSDMIAVLRGNTKRKFASLLQTKDYSSFMKAKAHEKDELHVSWCDDVHAMLSRSLNK